MKLAAIQYRPPKGEPELAREQIVALVHQAAGQGAQVVVLPEMATTGYIWSSPQEVGPHSELPRGPTYAALAAVARVHGIWIFCGYPERMFTGRARERRKVALFNSALAVMPDGELATSYRKMLLYEADTRWANAGWRRAVCRTEFGRIAPAICMDLNDSAFLEFLGYARPDIVAFCTNWVQEDADVHGYWRQRLHEAGWSGWFVAANTWGTDRGTRFSGRSAILDPDGVVVAEAPVEGDAVIVAEIPEADQPAPAL